MDYNDDGDVYLTNTFQNDSLLSSAQQMYGSRECQQRPPNNFNDAINSGSSFLSDFKCATMSVTFGRPILATICCAFGAYLIAKPPSSWSVFVSIARLQRQHEMNKYLVNSIQRRKNRTKITSSNTYYGHRKSYTLASPADNAVTNRELRKHQSASMSGDLAVSIE